MSTELTIIYYFKNHDSSHQKPMFEKYTLAEYNAQFGTNYQTAEEASEADPEYIFTEAEMKEFISE